MKAEIRICFMGAFVRKILRSVRAVQSCVVQSVGDTRRVFIQFIMFKYIFIFVLISFIEGLRDTEVTCPDVQSKSPTIRLRKHLFCDYDPKVQPKTSVHTSTTIKVKFYPLIVNLNEHSNTIDFHSWVSMSWTDIHLNWTPADFENVKMFHTKSSDIWTPDLSVFNIGSGGGNAESEYSCLITNNGNVTCLSTRVFTSRCLTDFSNWPYDRHNCSIHFGSWMYFAHELKFEFGNDSLIMSEFVEHQEWDIEISNTTSLSNLYNTAEDSMFFLRVELQRHSIRAIIVYITPAMVLMILTLTVLWLDSSSLERIAVASISFLCHILCIFDIHWYLPSAGALNSPKILVFYEASIVISAFTLILTCFLRKIHAITIQAPSWIASITLYIINSPFGRLLSISTKKSTGFLDESEGGNENIRSAKDQIWRQFASVFELFSFIIILLIYFIMIAAILPTPTALSIRS